MVRKHGTGEHRIHDFSAPDGDCGRRSFCGVGWASAEMVRRYAHLAADHLAPYAERLCALPAVEEEIHGTFTAQA